MLPTFLIAEAALPAIMLDRGGMWMLAGFVMLGWALARMTIKRRKNAVRTDRDQQEMQRRLDSTRSTALPLSDAPIETQRWQVAMFDLQRELKGELDSRITVTQQLLRQVDERIAVLEQLERNASSTPSESAR